jgi:hypothetical protein
MHHQKMMLEILKHLGLMRTAHSMVISHSLVIPVTTDDPVGLTDLE